MIKFCNLFSGSSGNSLFIRSGKTSLLVDAGLPCSNIEISLRSINEDPAGIHAIILTHDHSDHMRGIEVFSKRYDIPVYANLNTWLKIDDHTKNIKEKNKRVFCTNEIFETGGFGIFPFPIPHDAAEPVAFCLFAEGKKVTTATDIGHMNDQLFDNFSGSDLLFLESNHDVNMLKIGPYPYFLKRRILGEEGHLSNEDCSKTICRLAKQGMRRFILGHLSRENNYPALAYETTNAALFEIGISAGKDVSIDIAPRDRTGNVVYI